MNYEDFIEVTAKKVEDEFKEYGVRAIFCQKIGEFESFIITTKELPNVKLMYNTKELYEMYQNGLEYDCCLEAFYTALEDDLNEKFDEVVWKEAMDKFNREKIRFMLVNHKTEESDLDEYPHRVFHDMAIMYYYIIDKDEENILTRAIDNEALAYLELEECDLYAIAVDNMDAISVVDTAEALDVKPHISSFMAAEENTICGSTVLLNQNFLQEFSEHYEDNLYLCPVDKFAVFIFPAKEFEAYEIPLNAVLLNNQITPTENRLSNQIFHYDSALGLMTAVTDFVRSVE